MSLFQCQICGCCENTALSYQGCVGFFEKGFNWTGIEYKRGKRLCSFCGPKVLVDNTLSKLGKWHNKFDRTFLPMDMFKTNQQGDLEHILNGDTNFMNYEIKDELLKTQTNIYAYTGATPEEGYPGFISLNEQEDKTVTLTVRTPGQNGTAIAQVVLPKEVMKEFSDKIQEYLTK